MAENILLIRLKAIGDVVLTLPAVNAVRENFPDAKITFLTSKENALFLQGFRAVNEVIALDRARLKTGNPLKVAPEFFGLLRKLRAGKFSLVVDFQGFGETAWLTRLTGAPQRWGSIYSSGRAWAYTHGFTRDDGIHPAGWHCSLLRQCGLKIGAPKNEFVPPPEALAGARNFFAEQKLDPAQTTLYLQPFTSTPHKNWPLENYLALARHWRGRGAQIIFGGGPKDLAQLEVVRKEGFILATGVSRWADIGLMQLSSLVVGGDTGFLHLAVAMGRRVVMLQLPFKHISPHPFGHPDWSVTPENSQSVPEISLATVIAASERAVVAQASRL
jgi:ADP-heptose:LPS heptosyltransferase